MIKSIDMLPMSHFFTPLETSESLKTVRFSFIFSWVQKCNIGNKWVNGLNLFQFNNRASKMKLIDVLLCIALTYIISQKRSDTL